MEENPLSPPDQLSEDRKYYLEKFTELRDNYSDDLPATEVPTGSKYKCRGNWWNWVRNYLKLLKRDGCVDAAAVEISSQIDAFIQYTHTIDFEKFRTCEEINEANKILNTVINYLEKKMQEPENST